MYRLLTVVCLLLVPLAPLRAQDGVPEGMSASELLAVGEQAFQKGDWEAAATAFLRFSVDFGGLPETEGTVARIKPLLGICYVRMERMEEALPLLEEGLRSSDLDPRLRNDVLFFAGLAGLSAGDAAQARDYLAEVFKQTDVGKARRIEALMLGGTSYVMERNWEEVARFFEEHGETIASHDPEAGARMRVVTLHALMEEERWDDAAAMAFSIEAGLRHVRQVVMFASQLIALGDHFLEEGESHRAIRVLRLVPSSQEIIRLQNRRLAAARRDLEIAKQTQGSVSAGQLQKVIAEITRDLESFTKNPQFDSAARLRIASAYFQLQRVREACLILDQMVRQMEPDAIVESAAASLMRGWMSLERHKRSVRTADMYMERCRHLEEQPNLPEVMFLRAQALEGLFRHQEAADGYREVAHRFPDHDIAPRAEFMAAYNILQLEDYAQSGRMLDAQRKKLSETDEMWAHVTFWRGMAHYFAQDWDDARQVFTAYLDAVEEGGANPEYVDDAHFRIAFSDFSEAKYEEAIDRFRAFEREFPASEWLPEALLAYGDALAGEGELGQADQVYARITEEAPGFHDEGWMKRGNLLKAKKDLAGMRALFSEFLEQRPESPRLAEALQWLGWVERQEGDLEAAREVYWQAIRRFGNDRVRSGLEEIMVALQSFYPADQKAELVTRYRDMLTVARDSGKRRLAVRTGWALAHFERDEAVGEGSDELRERQYQKELVALVPLIDPRQTAPEILADVGDVLMERGDGAAASAMYDDLRKWWPRAPERDRAFAGLGFLSAESGDGLAALEWFAKFGRTAIMPRTAEDENGVVLVQGELGGKVAMAEADLLADRDEEKALHLLLAVQKNKSMPIRTRAEALMKTARLHGSRKRYRESLPYFEQIYILYNRFPELVAEAYLGRGQALEELGMNDKAREVYSELVNRGDLVRYKQSGLAAERARALGGVIPPAEPDGSFIPPATDSP